jgi:DNA-binding helix-hairpin-helix protein with protein kinase domain
MHDHLRNHLIRCEQHRIKLLTNGRLTALGSSGIETAADVDKLNRMKVPGIGPETMRQLLDWKAAVIRSFRYDPNRGIPPAEQQSLDAKYIPDLRNAADTLECTLREARIAIGDFKHEEARSLTEINNLVKCMTQAKADLEVME